MVISKDLFLMRKLAAAATAAAAIVFVPAVPTGAQSTVPAAHGVPQHHLQIINMDIDFHPHKRPEQQAVRL